MKRYYESFRAEMNRMFTFQYLAGPILFVMILITFGSLMSLQKYEVWSNETVYGIFQEIILGGFFIELIYIPASFYVVINLWMDIRQKGYYLYASRSGKTAYILAKVVVGILFSIVVTEIAFNLMLVVGTTFFQMVDTDYYSGGSDVFEDVLRYSPILYFELRITFLSLSVGFFTATGMIMTAVMPNKYIAIVSSYLLSRMIPEVGVLIPLPANAYLQPMWEGFIRVSSSAVLSVAYVAGVFMVLTIISVWIFNRTMKWRCFNAKY